MEYELFISEWFRTTWITRKRSIHDQLGEFNEAGCRLEFTVAERTTMAGRELLQIRLWRMRRG